MPYTKEGAPYQLPGIASRMAAESVARSAETQRQDILLFIQHRGEQGATDEEIRDGMGILMNSINPRRGELVKLGLVANSGEMRLTRQKRWATVWKAVAHCPTTTVLSKKESQLEQVKAELKKVRAERDALRERCYTLERAIEAVLEGEYQGPHRFRYSTGQCPHSRWYWEGCDNCIRDYLHAELDRARGE